MFVRRLYEWLQSSIKTIFFFKKKPGLGPNDYTCDEQDIIKVLHDKFEGKIILTHYCIKNKRLDAYLPEYKIEIEIDKYKHEDRSFNYEQSKTKMIENHEITLIRTNPNDPNFGIKNFIVQICICINEAIKKQAKKSMV